MPGLGLGTSIISGALGLGSMIYGNIKSGEENKKARQLIQQQRDDNRHWYNTRMAEDYTQRADAQAVINKQRELAQDLYKSSAARNIVAGGTDESLAMQQESANSAIVQTMSDIAANAASHKDNIEQQFRQQDAALNQQQAQTHANQAQAVAQAAGQAAGASLNLMGQAMENYGKNKELKNLAQ